MKAMIFAAGYGQRLRPLTDRIPKALVPVGGRPMIEYPLLLVRHYGIRQVIINVHHLGPMIEEYLGDGKKLGLEITYSREEPLLDTGGGLWQAKTYLADGTFVVVNSDVMIDLPLSDVLEGHRQKKAIATLVLRKDPRADRFGPVEISPDLRIQKFLDFKAPRFQPLETLTKFMFTGVQVLEPGVFDFMDGEAIRARQPFSTTKVMYPRMVTEGEPVYGFPFSGFWQDLGTSERIKQAEGILHTGQVKLHYLK